jgi:hypothetical protein
MSGNGSLTGSHFNADKVLPTNNPTSMGGDSPKYNSNLVGGFSLRKRRKRRKLSSLRSANLYGNNNSFQRLNGGSRKHRKTRKHRKSKK